MQFSDISDITSLNANLIHAICNNREVDEKITAEIDAKIAALRDQHLTTQWEQVKAQKPTKATTLYPLQCRVTALMLNQVAAAVEKHSKEPASPEESRLGAVAVAGAAVAAAAPQRPADPSRLERVNQERADQAKKEFDSLISLKKEIHNKQRRNSETLIGLNDEQAKAILRLDAVEFGNYIITSPSYRTSADYTVTMKLKFADKFTEITSHNYLCVNNGVNDEYFYNEEGWKKQEKFNSLDELLNRLYRHRDENSKFVLLESPKAHQLIDDRIIALQDTLCRLAQY